MQCIQIIKDHNETTIKRKKKTNMYLVKWTKKNINDIPCKFRRISVQMINEIYGYMKRAISKNIMVNRIFTMIP